MYQAAKFTITVTYFFIFKMAVTGRTLAGAAAIPKRCHGNRGAAALGVALLLPGLCFGSVVKHAVAKDEAVASKPPTLNVTTTVW